jgi:two-component system response regulator RegX3
MDTTRGSPRAALGIIWRVPRPRRSGLSTLELPPANALLTRLAILDRVARTVLVVEDEPTLRETLAEALEEEGYRVLQAGDGRSGLALFRADHPDLVLLDLMLPELSGLEVTRQVRAESSVPIVMLTARDAEVDKVVGLELGADDYVTKPFSLRELSARIRAVLRRGESLVPALPPRVPLGPVEVDVAGHRVLRDGREVPLKPKVFELLAFLLRHPGQVVSRDQLLERVWGYDYPGETRTVDVHVHWLRSAIEPEPANPTIIQTVRGVGYVLRRPEPTPTPAPA